MDWKSLLAYITGSVDQELLVRNAYLVTENRVLRNQIKGRVRLTDGERKAGMLSPEEQREYAAICDLDTALSWLNRLARGAQHR